MRSNRSKTDSRYPLKEPLPLILREPKSGKRIIVVEDAYNGQPIPLCLEKRAEMIHLGSASKNGEVT